MKIVTQRLPFMFFINEVVILSNSFKLLFKSIFNQRTGRNKLLQLGGAVNGGASCSRGAGRFV